MSRYHQLFAFILILVAVASFVVFKYEMRRGLDLAGGMRVVYEVQEEPGQKYDPSMRQSIANILEKRVNASGVVEPTVQTKGERQFIVEVPHAVKDQEKLAEALGRPTKLEFRYFQKVKSTRNPNAPYEMRVTQNDKGKDVYTFTDPQGKEVSADKVISESPLLLTGADLKNNARADIEGMQSVVLIEFKPEGKEKFADFTRKHVDDILAIILNDEILMAPTINEPILGGQARISGNFTTEEAQQLAEFLNAGALPVPLVIVENTIVEATLGTQYVNQSIKAGLYGLLMVVIFMIVYYLLPGMLAVIALMMYSLFTFAILKSMGVTMTLPGLAGFILSIGMAVDANILIFERMKEELRAGKTLHSAIDAGFSRAWTAILDSNVCTIITCLVLISLSSGPVVGFAKTLAIGVLVSMFTAITVSRTLLYLVTGMRFAQNTKLYGLGMQWGHRQSGPVLNIIGKSPMWFTLSGVLVISGLVLLSTTGLKKGIDFTGGTMIQASFPSAVTTTQVRQAIAPLGFDVGQVQISKDADRYTAYIRMRELRTTQVAEVGDAIAKKYPGARVESSNIIGPSISKEITQKAILAVVLASLVILLYLTFRFAQGGFADGFKFGACALFALIHDIIIVLGASALFGKLFNWEIDGAYVTAVLTVIGYSVHDTIVIFDRVRENQKTRLKGEAFETMVNRSILQSFARSINTSLTVMIVLATLIIWGGSVIRHFNSVMLVGIFFGTYSSIFVASTLLVVWERMARKAKGQLTAAEMKPLVSAPVSGGDTGKTVVSTAEYLDNGSGDADSDKSVKKTPSASAKRRKRRF